MKFLSVVILLFVERSSAVIYRLNESDYYLMPPVTQLEPYERCMSQPGAVYCSAQLSVVADGPSELYSMMQEYTEHIATHFNRTRLFYGVCLTNTCKQFYKPEANLTDSLEACLNQTLWDGYQLKTRVVKLFSCDKYGDTKHIDAGDIVVAVLFVTIFILNFVGSIYGFYSTNNEEKSLLLCFSVTHNWAKLVQPPDPAPEVARFRGLSGMRTLTMLLVILGHAFLPSAFTTINEFEFEQMYDNLGHQIFFNGTLIVQTFFVMSGFLMMNKILSFSETHQLTWTMLPQRIISRWLRLTPSYAVILAFTSTWLRFVGSGPLWARVAEVEVDDCRRDWIYNLLYLNNYIDGSQCMAQTWYLAADMQLHILGLLILVLFQSSRARKIALGCLLMIGLLTPAIHTFVQDLNAVLIVSPTIMTTFFVTEPTFNNVYKRGHTNIINFALGLIAGWIVHSRQRKQDDETSFKKYRYCMWMLWPAMLTIVDTGAVFYMDRPQPPILVRAVYSSLVKASFGLCQVFMILGMVFKVEDLYRGILEWKGWTTLARLSYCACLLHITFIRILGGQKSTLTHVSFFQINSEVFGVICITLLASVPFWLMVESPLSQVVGMWLAGKKEKAGKEEKPAKTDENMNETAPEKKAAT